MIRHHPARRPCSRAFWKRQADVGPPDRPDDFAAFPFGFDERASTLLIEPDDEA
jgi:hypothetical protein